jgi:hypothetical protein
MTIKTPLIPAKAGIQADSVNVCLRSVWLKGRMDPRRRGDERVSA